MDEKRSFGEYIRRKRQDAGLTQRELAQRLYVAESTVSKWERGLSYPDVSLIPAVCRALSISEHEFFTACDDDSLHAQERAAQAWRRMWKVWWWVLAVSYAGAAVICLICDLAVFRRLDWFWIVLTSLLLAFSLTNLPLMLRRDRLPISMGAASVCLVLLLLSCWLYTGGRWVLGGLVILMVCLALPWGVWALARFYGRHLLPLALALLSGWLFLLLSAIRLFAGGAWLLSLAFPIAAFCLAWAWALFAVLRWLPAGGWIKAGLCTGLAALALPVSTAFADRLTGGRADPKADVYFQWGALLRLEGTQWINTLVFLCLLAAAAVFLILGAVRAARRREELRRECYPRG